MASTLSHIVYQVLIYVRVLRFQNVNADKNWDTQCVYC